MKCSFSRFLSYFLVGRCAEGKIQMQFMNSLSEISVLREETSYFGGDSCRYLRHLLTLGSISLLWKGFLNHLPDPLTPESLPLRIS